MESICVNYQTFMNTPRGQNLHPISGLPANVFGYDFDTGDAPSPANSAPTPHVVLRRDASCPRSWKSNHPCPEVGQLPPWRNDMQWFYSALEPGTTINQLQNRRDGNGNVMDYSYMRYTCDEFPPATW
jgi:hypothetical protein